MPRLPKSKIPKIRLNLEMSDITRTRLMDLKNRKNSDSYTEVIRKAIDLYDALVTNKESGGEIIIKKSGKETKVIFM